MISTTEGLNADVLPECPAQSTIIRIEAQRSEGAAPRVMYEFTYRGNFSTGAGKDAEIQALTELLRKTLTATL